MVPAALCSFFVLLFTAMMVALGVITWWMAIPLGVGLVYLEYRLFLAGHVVDGDDASDEPHHLPPRKPDDGLPKVGWMPPDTETEIGFSSHKHSRPAH